MHIRLFFFCVSLLAVRQHLASAAPTWPAPTDELEDLLYLNTGYRSIGFAAAVTPCSKGLSPSRVTAAEWLRTAFHDAISGNIFTGTGGLDGSIAWETDTLENEGVFAEDSVKAWADYVSDVTSLADVIAAATYSLTRSCSNISITVRGGRIDATESGPLGFVPQPQNAVGIFRNQFARMGLDDIGMVQFVACGHSIGGVHGSDHPLITDAETAPFDTTPDSLDNAVAVEYVRGVTTNPLVVGKSVANRRNSDFKVFSQTDNNETIGSLAADPVLFASACQSIFQRMIDFVPAGVQLSEPVLPYDVKPYALQLTLLDGGSRIRFTGEVRVRVTQGAVSKVQLAYKDRDGAAVETLISTAAQGTASGFDDTFAFFAFSTDLPVDTSISSFEVLVTYSNSTQATFDNNGSSFPVQDAVIYQAPQSCLDSSGKLTVVAAVRETQDTPNLKVMIKVPQASPNPVPSISTTTVSMATQSAVGAYQLFSASLTLDSSVERDPLFDVFGARFADTRKSVGALPKSCKTLATPIASSTAATSTPSSGNSSSSEAVTSTVIPSSSSLSTSAPTATDTSISRSSTRPNPDPGLSTSSSTSVSPSPTSTPDFRFEGCYSDAVSPRALSGKSSHDTNMTIESCFASCSSSQYFGLEYSNECYCGNILDPTSTAQPPADCNSPCSGNSSQTCGSSRRLSLYTNLRYSAPVNPSVAGYDYKGCYSDDTTTRALQGKSFTKANMTVRYCASLCSGSVYFGVEYSEYVSPSPASISKKKRKRKHTNTK